MLFKRPCPVCHNSYFAGEEFCPQDGSPLLPPVPETGPADEMAGRVIAGRFVLQELLGAGGMGLVYRAVHRVLERSFAIKLLRREFIADVLAQQRFMREARAASALSHPHIISIYDYGWTEEDEPYLAMEFIEGVSLFQLKDQSPGHVLPVSQAVDIALQVARALQHAHAAGVVHRDLKPENILLTQRDDQADFIKVLDFGVARILGQPPLTRVGDEVLGTPEFMAPELLTGDHEMGPAVDMYALGILLHDVILGDTPFSGPISEVLEGHLLHVPGRLSEGRKGAVVPADLDRLAADLLAKDPARRPSAAQTVAQLEHIRPRLPPRSMRSALLVQTYILNEKERGQALFTAQTQLLQRDRPALLPTVILPPLMRELDQLEADLGRSSEDLMDQADALSGLLWPPGMPTAAPPAIAQAREQLQACERAEEELGLHLALLTEQAERERQRVQGEREELHQRILGLSGHLQAGSGFSTGFTGEERQAMGESLAALERAYAELDRPGEAELQVSLYRPKILELHSEVHRRRRQLGEAVLAHCPAPGTVPESVAAARREVERALGHFDGTSATLSVLLSRASGLKLTR